ncbi:MAG: prepilin-type N-terminal cleavage/methylation domain-containing protein [Clostridium sp.]|nr:prepilin-type N-terminal cleavage/methylation domain-containing protein [Clostridium sp.]
MNKNDSLLKQKKKAFTLVEMIIVLAITVIVSAIMYEFLTESKKAAVSNEVNSTIQDEVEDIQTELVKLGTQSKCITVIDANFATDLTYSSLITDGTDNNVKVVASGMHFKYYDESEWQLLLNDSDGDGIGTLSINYPNGTNKEIAKHVAKIKIRPIDLNTVPDSSTARFSDSTGVQFIIELKMKKGYTNITCPVIINVKFRNKDATDTP